MSAVIDRVMAVCSVCGCEREVGDFARDASKANGRKSLCKPCDNAKSKRYYQGHRAEKLAKASKWQRDRDQSALDAPTTRERQWLREQAAESSRLRAQEKDKRRNTVRSDQNRDLFSARRWEEARLDADRPLMRAARFRARRKARTAEERRVEFNAKVLATYHADPQNWSTQKRRMRIFDRDGWRCRVCRRKVRDDVARNHPRRANVGHIVAKSTGGEWSDENLATLCFDCNRKDAVNKIPIQKHLVFDV